jgi:RNA polymerase sigma-70 factor (ECF subfamily)
MDVNTLYQLHYTELKHYVLSFVKCSETAQDLVQECYLIFVRTSADTIIDHPRGFLFRTASNLALDHLRHNKVIARHQEVTQYEELPLQLGVDTEVDDQQWRSLLHSTISELPPRCRDVFILNKLHALSYKEIADLLKISESAVEKHIINGLKHCRDQLGKHRLFS